MVSITIVCINKIILIILKNTTKFERHEKRTRAESSTAQKFSIQIWKADVKRRVTLDFWNILQNTIRCWEENSFMLFVRTAFPPYFLLKKIFPLGRWEYFGAHPRSSWARPIIPGAPWEPRMQYCHLRGRPAPPQGKPHVSCKEKRTFCHDSAPKRLPNRIRT